MCFMKKIKATDSLEPLTAKTDITCYKIVYKTKEGFAPVVYHEFRYKIGETTPQVVLKPRKAESNQIHLILTVNKGYHSYTSFRYRTYLKTAIKDPDAMTLIECIIPKGTKYYHSREFGEYVSEQIKPVKAL